MKILSQIYFIILFVSILFTNTIKGKNILEKPTIIFFLITGSIPMFLPQLSLVLSIFIGMNYSLPLYSTVVVMKEGTALDFSLKVLDTTSQWILDILEINRQTGEIELKTGWKEIIWKYKYQNKARSAGKHLQNCLFAKV